MKSITRIYKDLLACAALVLGFAPIYLMKLYEWPHQINTDEIAIMSTAKEWAMQPWGRMFEISNYFDFPAMVFMVYGKLSNLLGGVGLYNSRVVHAGIGLAIIGVSYFLFRQLLEWRWAIVATIILGVNHSLLMISRMAMRDNSGLLIEVLALGILYYGYQRKNWLVQFAGGVAAGLGWYVYFPARLVIFIWVGFLIVNYIKERRSKEFGFALSATLAGFMLIILPLLYQLFIVSTPRYSLTSRFMWTPEARNLQQHWVGAASETEGYITNIRDGLTTFNNRISDRGNIYINKGNGFVDPLTGITVWLGLIAVTVGLCKRRLSQQSVLMGTGFLAILLLFAFVINIAPNYTRLLISLPFVAYFATIGISTIEAYALKRTYNIPVISALIVGSIIYLNLAIAREFIATGDYMGDDVGGTARYILEKSNWPNHHFIVIADKAFPYYDWGGEDSWGSWTRFFVSGSQTVKVHNSNFDQTVRNNSTVLASGKWWLVNKGGFLESNPGGSVKIISKQPYLVAIEY